MKASERRAITLVELQRTLYLCGAWVIARVSRHIVAVIDGVIRDTYDPSRGGSRCVYGYWRKP